MADALGRKGEGEGDATRTRTAYWVGTRDPCTASTAGAPLI